MDWEGLEWRNNSTTRETLFRSNGISPKNFHKRRQNHREINAFSPSLQRVLNRASDQVVHQKRCQVTVEMKLRRSALRDVTSLRTWPLQEPAMEDYRNLCEQSNLGVSCKTVPTTATEGDSQDVSVGQKLCEFESEGSSAHSEISTDEPKRRKPTVWDGVENVTESLSPGKVSMKNKFSADFLAEQRLKQLVPPIDAKTTFLPALWSLDPRIFAIEKSKTGKRKYVVGHFGRWNDHYWRKMDPRARHCYELIPEGTPCRLYFDLEFIKAANPGLNGKQEDLLDEFFLELSSELESVYRISSFSREHVVDLDSSTSVKFSRHWIVHLPDEQLFADNVAVGRFVKRFVGRLAEESASGVLKSKRPMLSEFLLVFPKGAEKNKAESKEGKKAESQLECDQDGHIKAQGGNGIGTENMRKALFVDLGVYTKNRLFRLMGSAKFGKPASAALRIAEANEFPFPKGFSNERFYHESTNPILRDETTSPKDSNKNEMDMTDFQSALDWSAHAEALARTLVVPMNLHKIDYKLLVDESDTTKVQEVRIRTSSTKNSSSAVNKTGPSPFRLLDDYIVGVLGTRGGFQGSIRAWSLTKSPLHDGGAEISRRITYQMLGNRWCECVGRAHKSNNIMWNVDLQECVCFQTCHDPDCRALSFRGEVLELPVHVHDEIKEQLFEEELLAVALRSESQQIPQINPKNLFDDDEFEAALMGLEISDEKDASHSLSSGTLGQTYDTTQEEINGAPQSVPGGHVVAREQMTTDAIALSNETRDENSDLDLAKQQTQYETVDESNNLDSSLLDLALSHAIMADPDIFP